MNETLQGHAQFCGANKRMLNVNGHSLLSAKFTGNVTDAGKYLDLS